MASELDQAYQPNEEQELELGNEKDGKVIRTRINVGQVVQNLKQLKSFEILKSALKIFTSNTKLMFFIILSIIPLFSFMLFFEIKLQKSVNFAPKFLQKHTDPVAFYMSNYHHNSESDYNTQKSEFFYDIMQSLLFYLVIYPLLEIFSMIITMKITAKVHSGDQKQPTLKQVILSMKNNNLKGISVTCICVQLLSNLTLLGLFWILVNQRVFNNGFRVADFYFRPMAASLYILSVLFHSAIFVVLLYKYLCWSAFWNMGMVISVLEEETGIDAFGLSGYYGKHCKRTGFQLMLVFFVFSNFLRLPCLFAGLCGESVGGVVVVVIVIGLVCLGNVVKWVSFVLYFFDCKQHTLEKKADHEEVVKPANSFSMILSQE